MNNGIIAATTSTTDIEVYTGIVPQGFEVAHVIDPAEEADANGEGGWGICPICGHACRGEKGGGWLHARNLSNDSKKVRRYHYACLLEETRVFEAMAKTEGAPTKVGDGHTYVVKFRPLDGKDNADLAASMMTVNRQAEAGMTETDGAWFRLPAGGGYISPKMRNLRCHKRLGTIARACSAAIITVDIYLDGCYAETVTFSWRTRDEHARWVSKENHKHGFLVKLDWEVGKYRNHGKQQYNYKENRERAKVERDYGVWPRKLFWL